MNRPTSWTSIALLFLAAGCGDAPTPAPAQGPAPTAAEAPAEQRLTAAPADWPSDAERRLEADHAPTPFTAAQIRAGCPSGLRATYALEGGGRKAKQLWAFDNADDAGVDFTMTKLDADGATEGTPRTTRPAWTSLQRHADYPSRFTEITQESVTVPAGTFFCMHYTVSQPDDGKISVGDYWFAYELPGAPVKWTQSADGQLLITMELEKREIVKE